MDIISSKPVSVVEAKELLLKRKEQGELEYEQNQSLEHAEKFLHVDEKTVKKKVHELMKVSSKITDEVAFKIVDIMPKKADTLRAILIKDKVELTEEEQNAVLAVLQ